MTIIATKRINGPRDERGRGNPGRLPDVATVGKVEPVTPESNGGCVQINVWKLNNPTRWIRRMTNNRDQSARVSLL
jgi:hypothetical protein